MAGLNGFWPNPPNRCLTTTRANRVATTTIHQGAVGGRLNASSAAVTSAEPSETNSHTGLPRMCSTAASAARAVVDASASCTSTAGPKHQT
jgi:hypothetical protein